MNKIIFSLLLLTNSVSTADQAFQDFSRYFAGIEGLEIEESEAGSLILKGLVHRQSDFERIEEFVKLHPEVKNATKPAPELKVIKRERPSKVSIFLEIALIEVNKSAFSKLGFRFQSPLEGSIGLHIPTFANAGQKVVDPLRVFLDLALQNGMARVHAKQSLLTENGGEGEFKVGGEFPIKVVSGIVAKVVFKEFGLILKFAPVLVSNEIVRLSVDAEISDIDTGSMIDGIPIVFQKHLKTKLHARLGEMIAIGGVVRSSDSQMDDSIPGLSAIPILGRLFQSKEFKRNQSEAYIFMTPQVMKQPWLPSPEL